MPVAVVRTGLVPLSYKSLAQASLTSAFSAKSTTLRVTATVSQKHKKHSMNLSVH